MTTLKELQVQLSSISAELSALQSKAVAIQTIMAKGWSAPAMQALEASLKETNALITQLQGKKVNVLNESSLKGYNSLLKSIETIQAKIAEQAVKLSQAPVGSSIYDVRLRQLQDYERALNSFESRRAKNYDPQGLKYQYKEPIGPPIGDYGNVGPKQDPTVLIEKKLKALAKESAELQKVMGMRAPDARGVEQARLDQITLAVKRLTDAYINLNNQKANAFGGFGNESYGPGYIPGGATKGAATDAKPSTGGSFDGITTQKEKRDALIAQLEAERQAWIKANKAMLDYARTQGIVNPEKAYKSTLLGGATGAYDISTFKEKNAMGEWNTLKVKADKQGNLSSLQPVKAQQSFAQGITKDIGDLLKWSVAIAAIYGPINAASEAMKQLIENESKLADVSIALNSSLATTNQIFDDTYEAARRSGEGVSGIIEAFGAAYTAAGRIQDPIQRYQATLTLLDDALVLSKLSTLDQAGAIDTLTAALYQTGNSSDDAATKLSKGRALIDQWVQVSKIASVTVETLATGVAVLGDSAETAGLSLEQMNAMVATLSEVSLSSGKETANIAKALIGNYQQESAVKELNRLGIAVTDTSGKTREFLSVMKEVAALRSQGLLGDQDFSRLTLALGGGGIRRQKDVAAFIENFARMEQIAGAQGGSAGSSSEAMAKKLDTVQTASTNLTSAFTNLAQTMGNEGGLLDMFSLSIKGATGLVDVLNAIAAAVGKVGPLLLGLGVGSIIMRSRAGAGGVQAMLMNNLGMGGLSSGLLTGNLNPANEFLNRGLGPEARRFGGNNMFGAGTMLGRATTLPSMAAVLGPAISNLSQGDTTEAGANIAGGIVGALAGGPVGALVGSAIAEAFVRTTLTYDKQFADFFAGAVKPEEAGKPAEAQADLTKEAMKAIGGGSELFGSLRVFGQFAKETLSATTKGVGVDETGAVTGANKGDFFKYLEGFGSIFSGKSTQTGGPSTRLASALEMLKTADPNLYNQIQLSGAVSGVNTESTNTKLTQKQKDLSTTQTQNYLFGLQSKKQEELRGQLITGDLKPADYQNRMSSLSAYTITANRWLAAMETGVGGVGDAFSTTEEAYQAFLEILASGNQESINNINSQIATVIELQNIVDNWDPKEKTVNMTINGMTKDWTKAEVQTEANALTPGISISASQAAQQARLSNLDLRSPQGGMGTTYSPGDARMIAKEAARLDKVQYANLRKDDLKALKESWDEVSVNMVEGGKEFVEVIKVGGENISKENWGAAEQNLKDKGLLTTSGGTDWQVGSASAEQYRIAEAKAPAFTKMLESKGVTGLKPLEETVVTTTDKQTIVSHGDQKVIQYLLQQILDTEKKQLQGIYNLPEGANIMVPFQGYELGMGTGTGTETPLTDVNGDNLVAKNSAVETVMGKSGLNSSKFLLKNNLAGAINNAATQPMYGPPAGLFYENRDKLAGSRGHANYDQKAPAEVGIIDQLMNVLKSILSAGSAIGAGGVGSTGPANHGIETVKPLGLSGASAAPQPQTSRLDIKMTSTTNLMVDGRVLATIVKPYLASDLLKVNQSGGTVTKSFVL